MCGPRQYLPLGVGPADGHDDVRAVLDDQLHQAGPVAGHRVVHSPEAIDRGDRFERVGR